VYYCVEVGVLWVVEFRSVCCWVEVCVLFGRGLCNVGYKCVLCADG
jgi:hypothetical protein